MLRTALRSLAVSLAVAAFGVHADAPLPKGLMLNLDFRKAENGVIPSKALYPLHVPMEDLYIMTNHEHRVFLMLESEQGLDIPHSSLLDPDGSGWVATIRIFALSEGIVMSQGDDSEGYAIYIKDGVVHATINTGTSTITLRENPRNGITKCLNKWVTVELKIKPDMATLILNRAHAAAVPLQMPLTGKNHRIRIGEHKTLPAPLRYNKAATTTGFTGAISSFKLLRQ
ncbi:MAG: LamG domain-containing protein [Verrucomicrobiota bacterium]